MGRLRVSDSEALLFLQTLPLVSQPVRVRRSSEGGEHIVWTVNDALILRIPVDQRSTEPLLRERRLLDLIRNNAKIASVVPPCIDIGTWTPHGWQYALYHKAIGISIESDPLAVTNATEDGLVELLVGLGDVSVGDALGIGVPEGEGVDFEALAHEATAALEFLREQTQLMELDGVVSLDNLRVPLHVELGGSRVQRVLTHADLKGEHVFLDEAGRVTGVIDWSDAQVGCPSFEVAGLVVSVGARMAARIAKRAGHEAEIVWKGVIMARCNGVVCLGGIVRGRDDSPEWLVRRQLARSFEEFDA